MSEPAAWRRSLAELGLDPAPGLPALDTGQLLRDTARWKLPITGGRPGQEAGRRVRPSEPGEPIVDTPPTPAALPDGPLFWSVGASSSGGAGPAALSQQYASPLEAAARGGGAGVPVQRRAAAAALGWRSAPQRSFPPSGGGLEVQEISSETWQEPLSSQDRGGVLVQEAETDPESVPGSPLSPRSPPERRRAQHGVSIVELHFAEEEHEEEHWEHQESDGADELLVLPEPALGATDVTQGGDEPALRRLRPLRRLMHPVRRCLSPMAEESCEELDWSEPPALTASEREDEEEDVEEEEEEEEEEEASLSSSGSVIVREDAEDARSESLPVESRVRPEETAEETWSESLPNESRTREIMDRIEESEESLPVESRSRGVINDKVMAESLPTKARRKDEANCDISCSESLPVESRIRAGCVSKRLTNGLSVDSVTSDESPKTSRSETPEDTTESSQSQGRPTQHRTSWSLPSDAVKTDFKICYIPRLNGSPTNGQKATESNSGVTTRISWSLPNEARRRSTNGSPPGSDSKDSNKRDPDDNGTMTQGSSLTETRTSERRQRKRTVLSGSVPNEARVKEEEPSNGSRTDVDGSHSTGKSERVASQAQGSSGSDTKKEGAVEVIDRTDDKKYNFSALRMKRKQAQETAKNKKEGTLKTTRTRQSKRSVDASTTKDKPNTSGCQETNNVSDVSRVSFDSAQDGDRHDSVKPPGETMKSDGDKKTTDVSSAAPRSKTSREIIQDLESDTSWRTVRATDPKENNADERLEPPSVVTPLADIECYVTETLMLTAEVKGHPSPEARWTIKPSLSSQQTESVCTPEGQLVETGENRLIQRHQDGLRHRLVLPRLSYMDAGRYTVTFRNGHGQISSQCKVVVKPLTELRAPHFFTPLVPRAVRAGERTELSCEVRGSPLPKMSWLKDSVELRAGPTVQMSYKLTTGLCSLILPYTTTGDGGVYTCRATNQHGRTQIQTTLQVLEAELPELPPSSDSTEMSPKFNASHLSAEETPSKSTGEAAKVAPSNVTSTPPDNTIPAGVATVPAAVPASSAATTHDAEQKSRENRATHRNEITPPDTTPHPTSDTTPHKDLVVPGTKPCSGDGSSKEKKAPWVTQLIADADPCPVVVAPPGSEGRPTEKVAPSNAPGSTKRTQALSADTTSPSTTPESKSSLASEKAKTSTKSDAVKSPVVINHTIEVAASQDSLKTASNSDIASKEIQSPNNKSKETLQDHQPLKKTTVIDKGSENVPATDKTLRNSSVDKSPKSMNPGKKSEKESSADVRSLPVQLTLPEVRSHPIQVPAPVETSHPIEVHSTASVSKAEAGTRKTPTAPSDTTPKPDRLLQPSPPPQEEKDEATTNQPDASEQPPPTTTTEGDAADQLTATGASEAAAAADTAAAIASTDTTDAPTDAPTSTARPVCQHSFGRQPEERPATRSRLRRAQERAEERVIRAERALLVEQRALSNPPPVISWRNTRSAPGSAPVKAMTSPEKEVAMDAAEPATEEAAPVETPAASEEAEITETTQPAEEAAPEEVPVAKEVASPPPAEAAPKTEEPAAEPAAPEPAAAEPATEEPAAAEEPSTADEPSVQPPSVEEALAPVQAVAGCPARLEGRVSGLPKPTVAWTRNGATLHPDGERVITYHHDDGTFGLQISESREEDVGTYAATAVNAAGQAATEAAFKLLDTSTVGKEWAPDFTTPLLGAKVDEGATIELDTHITGVPLPEITWTKNGVPLEDGGRVSLRYESDKAALTITPAESSDAGMYKITIKNKLGEVSSAVKVKINKIYTVPQIAEKLTDVQQITGLDAKFSCRITGLPKPEVQWLFNEQPLKSSKKHKIRTQEDACTLSVRECGEEDNGTYTCKATNSEGSVTTSAELRVVEKLERKPKLEAPLFLKSIGDCEVFPGMQARFTGCVAGNPEPECEWYRNDVRIYPSDRIVVENDGSGLVRLTLRTVDETDAGRYRLRIRNSEGEAACEADLTYDSFENTPTKPLKDQYQTLERQLKSGIPMPLADPPIISRMSDRQLTLSWKPSPAAGAHIPPTYTVEMAKMPEGGFAVINTGVRGCSVEIKRLEPQCDYKFRVIVENKHGASEPSPHTVAHRVGLVLPPPPENPTLPDGDTFRPDSSPLFPKGFDMEKHTGGKGHPPTNGVSRNAGDEDDSWRYDRFDPDAHTARLASQRLVLPFPAEYHPPAVVPQSSEPRPARPRDALPPSARLRPLTDDVDGYVPPSGGRPRRVAHGEEWETKRGSNIVERLLVRKQMEEASKSFKRAAGLETRNMARYLKPRASERASDRLSERRWDDDDDREVPRSSSVRPTRSFLPSRTAAEIVGASDDDELDAPLTTTYTRPSHHSRAASVLDEDFDTPSSYSRGVGGLGSSRHARAASVLDDEDDDDDLEMLTRRRPAPHTARTATLLAAAADSDDEDMTPYLRRPPRILGTRDWSSAVTPARSVRATRSPINSSRDREYQERRERHQELLNSRNRELSAVPTVTPDWQGELERHLRGRGLNVSRESKKSAAAVPTAREGRSLDTSSVRDWESRFAGDV